MPLHSCHPAENDQALNEDEADNDRYICKLKISSAFIKLNHTFFKIMKLTAQRQDYHTEIGWAYQLKALPDGKEFIEIRITEV